MVTEKHRLACMISTLREANHDCCSLVILLRERIINLEQAIKKHRRTIYGDDFVTHPVDAELYKNVEGK